MTAFFQEVMEEVLTPSFLEGVRKKYHFEEAQRIQLRKVAGSMLRRMRREAFWDKKECLAQDILQAVPSGKIYERVVMTLGHGIDQMQEGYSDRGWLLESYMTEVLASEILLEGYHAYEQYIITNTGWQVVAYHFPGSEAAFPLELLPDLLKEYAPRITYNSAFCISPNKSVAFFSELTREAQAYRGSICLGCTNRSCFCRMGSTHKNKP